MNLTDYLSLIIVGVCTGLGSAIGNFLAQWSFIRHIDKLGKKEKDAETE